MQAPHPHRVSTRRNNKSIPDSNPPGDHRARHHEPTADNRKRTIYDRPERPIGMRTLMACRCCCQVRLHCGNTSALMGGNEKHGRPGKAGLRQHRRDCISDILDPLRRHLVAFRDDASASGDAE